MSLLASALLLTGTMTVVDKNGQRMLRAASPSEFLITFPRTLPTDFTVEVAAQGTNQARFFSGNFDWTTTLEVQGKPSDGNVGKTVESVSVGIVAGKALCKGTYNETMDTYQAGKLVSRATTVGTISGPGYALIEFGLGTDTHTGKPVYTITVSCPTHSGSVTSQSFVPGGSGSNDQIEAQPAEQGHHEWSTYPQLDLGNGQTLKGSTDDQHPDADPANNVSGRVKLTWALTRIAKP